jgi:FMNH2-dependent dimethyl sulfone monooxygenase
MLPMSEGDGIERMPTWSDMLVFARHAEDIGLDSVWVCDHFMSAPPEGPAEGLHEAWTVLAALAASTSRVELGQLVMCLSFRNPALLAKMAATADLVSGGRVTLGIGAGWHDPEYVAFGYPTDHRVDRFEEGLRIIGPLLRGETVTVEGRYHTAKEAALLPPPDRTIPLLVAAKGPRMLALTARHADAWNTAWFGLPDERLSGRLSDMEAALEAAGRDPATLRRTVGVEIVDPEQPHAPDDEKGSAFRGSVEELAEAFDRYTQLGIDDVIALVLPMTERSLDRVARAKELAKG